jgi:hypothetical protein
MMSKASWVHTVRGLVVGVLLMVATVTGLLIREKFEEKKRVTYSEGLVESVLNAETAQVPDIIGKMAAYRPWTDPLLRAANDQAGAKSRQKLHSSLALLPVDPAQVDYLYDRLLDAEPSEVRVLREALAPHKDGLLAPGSRFRYITASTGGAQGRPCEQGLRSQSLASKQLTLQRRPCRPLTPIALAHFLGYQGRWKKLAARLPDAVLGCGYAAALALAFLLAPDASKVFIYFQF